MSEAISTPRRKTAPDTSNSLRARCRNSHQFSRPVGPLAGCGSALGLLALRTFPPYASFLHLFVSVAHSSRTARQPRHVSPLRPNRDSPHIGPLPADELRP